MPKFWDVNLIGTLQDALPSRRYRDIRRVETLNQIVLTADHVKLPVRYVFTALGNGRFSLGS